jgi:hypothetical protein
MASPTTTFRSEGGGRRAHKRSPLAILEAATKSRTYARRRGMFGTPPWYDEECAAQQRAVWRGQLTEAEATFELRFWHRVLFVQMDQRKLWRGRRRSAPSELRRPGGWKRDDLEHGWYRPRKRFSIDARPCSRCGGRTTSAMGYFCAGCHFRGWWNEESDAA